MPAFKPNKPKPLSEVSSETTHTQTGHASSVAKAEKVTDEEDMDVTKSLIEITKALKAFSVLGMSRRARMDAAYKVGVAAGSQSPEGPFAAQDISKEKLNIGITKDQLRPSYEPPVVPVRRVETPGYLAPKPCGDHEYKTTTSGSEEAKPLSERK